VSAIAGITLARNAIRVCCAWQLRQFSGHHAPQIAGMGVSTLHHHFQVLTAMSPLQYQKQLRLQAARGRMLMDGLDAASAAFEVGYESASQFNREYSRFFGQPPMREIRTLRSPSAPPLESVNNG
jgi:AraC-like DNA-binding protein